MRAGSPVLETSSIARAMVERMILDRDAAWLDPEIPGVGLDRPGLGDGRALPHTEREPLLP